MALTAITLYENATKPKDQGYVSIGVGPTQGVTLSLDATSPNTGTLAQAVEISGNGAFYWSYQDNQVAADGTMVYMGSRDRMRVEVTGKALTLYMVAVAGTVAISVVQI